MLSAHVWRLNAAIATQHRVVNIAARGLCLAQLQGVEPGTAVIVSVGQAEHLVAEVVWVCGRLAGLRFRSCVDLDAARRPPRIGLVVPPATGWLAGLNSANGG